MYSSTVDTATVTADIDGGQEIGGIAGRAEASAILDATVSGSVVVVEEDSKTGNTGGGIAGTFQDGSIDNSTATGNISGNYYIGGLVGYIYNSEVTGSTASGNVSSASDQIGGFAGHADNTLIATSEAHGDVSGYANVGGFAGLSSCGSIFIDSSASGDVTATGGYIGGFVGGDGCEGPGSTFTRVQAHGAVTGGETVGGLIGRADQSTISESFADGAAEGFSQVGGLVGLFNYSSMQESFSSSTVLSQSYQAGGAIGIMNSGNVHDVYATGDVTIDLGSAGGFVGGVFSGTIDRSYASGNVISVYATGVGGFVGAAFEDYGDITLSNNFSAGLVTGSEGNIGGFFGNLYADGMTITNNHYDHYKSGGLGCNGASEAIDGCTADNIENANPTIFTSPTDEPYLSGVWDFDAVWMFPEMESAYPCLQWQVTCPSPVGDTDLNGDNIPDSEQPNIGGYVSPITGKLVAMDMGVNCELTTDDIARESELAAQDVAFEYDNGLFDFAADCTSESTTIKLYYYDVEKNDLMLRKFSTKINGYFTIEDAVITSQTIDSHSVTVVTYEIADNGERDMDPEVGSIEDPAGLARSILAAPNTGVRSNSGMR